MTELRIAGEYDRWLDGASPMSRGYAWLAGVPGAILINPPVFKLAENLGLRPEQRLLDIGCGRGSLLQIVSSRIAFAKPAVGIDVSRAMLTRARDDRRQAGSDYELASASALSLPFAGESFDVITSAYVVKHLDDDDLLLMLSEIRRVLKQGGIALLWEFAPTRSAIINAVNRAMLTRGPQQCRLRPYRELAAVAEQAGFEWVRNASLRPFFYPIIPRISLIAGKAPGQAVSNETEIAAALTGHTPAL